MSIRVSQSRDALSVVPTGFGIGSDSRPNSPLAVSSFGGDIAPAAGSVHNLATARFPDLPASHGRHASAEMSPLSVSTNLGGMRDGFHQIRLKDGSTYVGTIEGGQRCEFGTLTTLNKQTTGFVYRGQFKGDKRHGQGIIAYYQQGVIVIKYSGEWFNDNISGVGTLEKWSGDKIIFSYRGQFARSEINGYGILTVYGNNRSVVRTYRCNWVDGKMHGKGILVDRQGTKKPTWNHCSPDCSNLANESRSSSSHDTVATDLANLGALLRGYIEDNTDRSSSPVVDFSRLLARPENGWVRKRYKEGDIYEGQALHGLCHGYGTLTSIKGELSKRQGFIYKGYFENKQIHGLGEVTYYRQGVPIRHYSGGFECSPDLTSYYHGHGKLTTYSDLGDSVKSIYSGGFHCAQYHGCVVEFNFSPPESKAKAEWLFTEASEEELKKYLKDNPGRLSIIKGEAVRGLLHGHGVVCFNRAWNELSEWSDGQVVSDLCCTIS